MDSLSLSYQGSLEGKVSTTGPPGKPPESLLNRKRQHLYALQRAFWENLGKWRHVVGCPGVRELRPGKFTCFNLLSKNSEVGKRPDSHFLYSKKELEVEKYSWKKSGIFPVARGGKPIQMDCSQKTVLKMCRNQGITWWSSGCDSMLPVKGVQVQSLVGELRSHIAWACAPPPHRKFKLKKIFFKCKNDWALGEASSKGSNNVSRNLTVSALFFSALDLFQANFFLLLTRWLPVAPDPPFFFFFFWAPSRFWNSAF